MKFFFRYLRQKIKVIAAFVLFSCIFLITFRLYHLPLGAAAYPALLCAFFSVLFFIFDFIREKKRHGEMLRLYRLTAATLGELPKPRSTEGEDLEKLVYILSEEGKTREIELTEKYYETIDYYTVWAHQIKTPISSMRLALQSEDSALSRRLLRELFRIEQYVEMVLTFLRLNSSSTDYLIKEYEIDDIIKQSAKKFAGEFIDRKIKLEYSPVAIKAVTDEKWFSFVLEQVLSNALKYTSAGSVKIYALGEDEFCVEDTGMGISPEDLPRIFENGYTGYNGRHDKRASGIGLYLCKRICDNLGVRLSVSSVLGKGTKVSFRFLGTSSFKE